MASLVFNQAKLEILDGTINLSSDTFYACLVQSIPDATITAKSSLAQPTGGNYTEQALTGRNLVLDVSTVEWIFSNPVWSNLSISGGGNVVGMVIVKQAGGSPATTDPVVCYLEFASAYTPNSSTFQVSATDGVFLSLS